jgi:hypothetical protein
VSVIVIQCAFPNTTHGSGWIVHTQPITPEGSSSRCELAGSEFHHLRWWNSNCNSFPITIMLTEY